MHCRQKEKGQARGDGSFLSRYMPEHDDKRDEGECMNIEQMANAFQFQSLKIQTITFTKNEQTPERRPCNSHHPLG